MSLVWVGRENKSAPETELCRRYLTRIQIYAQTDQLCLKSLQNPALTVEEVQRRESAKILEQIAPGDFFVLCDERGKLLDSTGFSQLIESRARGLSKRLVIAIGGSYGVSAELKRRADYVLSLTPMTLPHALARVLVLEQVYRAFCILAGHPYHHEGSQ